MKRKHFEVFILSAIVLIGIGLKIFNKPKKENTKQLVLDKFSNAEAAFSFRKLSSSYDGPCVKIKRLSDNAEKNIGFTENGYLDEAAIKDFTNGGPYKELVWYDQSGNNNHLHQELNFNNGVLNYQ